ncbi:hypothetical protein OAI07_01265 [Akkermansiaceae bacterium]|nr:hypothetical protein [Akkermansiaceae bacterium]
MSEKNKLTEVSKEPSIEDDYDFDMWVKDNIGKPLDYSLLRECWDEARRVEDALAAEREAGADC